MHQECLDAAKCGRGSRKGTDQGQSQSGKGELRHARVQTFTTKVSPSDNGGLTNELSKYLDGRCSGGETHLLHQTGTCMFDREERVRYDCWTQWESSHER